MVMYTLITALSQKSTMVYKKACDEMKEIKEAMQSVINEIGYWVFLFVLLFVPWILKLIRFIWESIFQLHGLRQPELSARQQPDRWFLSL